MNFRSCDCAAARRAAGPLPPESEIRCRCRAPGRRRPRTSCTAFITGENSRDRAAAQVIAVGEAAGQNHGIHVAQIGGIVPDELGVAAVVVDGVPGIVVAIAAGKDDDADFHWEISV